MKFVVDFMATYYVGDDRVSRGHREIDRDFDVNRLVHHSAIEWAEFIIETQSAITNIRRYIIERIVIVDDDGNKLLETKLDRMVFPA